MRRVLGVVVVTFALAAGSAGVASADEAPASDSRVTCMYERWWDSTCPFPWTISVAQENAQLAKQHDRKYIVRKGDTLWRIAVRFYGPGEHAGHQWKRIAKANHVKGSTIRVGQVLDIPR